MKSSPPSTQDDRSSSPVIRRNLTVLFSDLCSSTRLGDATDPEIMDDILQEVKGAAFRVIGEHGGSVVQFHGDGVLAVFGHPTPREDDVRRATEAALELHKAVRELPVVDLGGERFSVNLHSGIHSGVTVVRDGDAVQGLFELVGDPPNTAAGLCSHAAVDEILVSAQTLLGAAEFFDTQELPPVRLKGKPEPMPVLRVLGRADDVHTRWEARASRGLAPFVGRAYELELLRQALRAAHRGSLALVRLVGDAGIGKTRTIEQFVTSPAAREFTVLRGYCESYGSVAPLQPFVLMLEQLFELGRGAHEADAAAQVEAHLAALGLEAHTGEMLRILSRRAEGEPQGSDAAPIGGPATVAALAALFGALAAKRSLVICIDDWQWVDDASRQLLATLVRKLRDAPVLVLTASRRHDPGDEASEELGIIELAPFTEMESAQAIDAVLPEGLDLGVAVKVYERSGGNPLFLEELCQSLVERHDSSSVPDQGVPATLHGLIEERVHRLPAAQAELVRAAAVMGDVIPAWLLEQISGHGRGDDILHDLARSDLLYPGETAGTYRFKHGITRDVIYQSVRLGERRELHSRIAEALGSYGAANRSDEPYEALAYHHAGGANHGQASHFAELAGDRAWACSALDRARQQFGAALDSLDQLEQGPEVQRRWLDVSRRLAFACVFSPDPEHLRILQRAAEIATQLGDLDSLGHSRFWLGFLHYCFGESREAIDQYQQGLRAAEQAGNAKLVAQLRANLAESHAAACDYPEALALLNESIHSKRMLSKQRGRRAPTGSAYAIACKACIEGELGDFAHSGELMDEALEAIKGAGSPVEGSIRCFRTIVLVWQGEWERCIESGGAVQAFGVRVNGPYLFGRGRSEAAYARFMLTRDNDALEVLRRTTEWLEARRMGLYISLNHGYLTDALATVGDVEGALHHGRRALERAAQHDRVGEGMACRAMAHLAAREGSLDGHSADHYLTIAMASARARGSAREIALTRFTEAELAAQAREIPEALVLLDGVRSEFQKMGMDWYDAQAARLAERLGTSD